MSGVEALFGVVRYSSDGQSLDATFSGDGIVTTPLPTTVQFPSGVPQVTGLGIQADGKIVAAGGSQNPDLVVARYLVQEGDTKPPTIVHARVNPSALWPPLHQMVPVRMTVNATDDSGVAPSCAITQIRSNQPIDSPGPWDGHTSPDYVVTGPLTARLRAEISLIMGRRTYTLTVGCQDGAGNTATTEVAVIVTLLPPGLPWF